MNPQNEAQIELEKLYHKNQLLPRLRQEFHNEVVVNCCLENNLPIDFIVDLMAQTYLHKRAEVGILVGLLHRHFGTGEGDPEDLQACSDMIAKACEAAFVFYDELAGEIVMCFGIDEETEAELELFQYPLPMVVPPKTVRSNMDSGYLTRKESLILKGGNHHEDDICLDHINRVNQTALTINPDTARMVQNKWKSLDKKKPDESLQDFKDRKAAFQKYDRNAKDVMELLFTTGDRFWMTHKYDKRGRTYVQGYHVSYQGNDWCKAVVEFANGETING